MGNLTLKKLGVGVPEIILPKQGTDMSKYAVVACDQYTSEPEYWNSVAELVGDAPSTLHLTLPEIYLESADKQDRIEKINAKMDELLSNRTLESVGECFVLVKRKTRQGKVRTGLVVSLDLEKYDFSRGSQTLIRATEGTVVERIPPRVEIRKNARIELPHIMVLIDDPEKTVIEPISEFAEQNSLRKLYDFDLMMDSGHITAYKIDDEILIGKVAEALDKLADHELFMKKYGVGNEKGVLLFAMGDGNHSLATAKTLWEEIKKSLTPEEFETHPARYALVELVNVHDAGLEFEPIHRVLFGVRGDIFELLNEAVGKLNEDIGSIELTVHNMGDVAEVNKVISSGVQYFTVIRGDQEFIIEVKNPQSNLAVGTLQNFINYLIENYEIKVDYIHGEEVVRKLSQEKDNIGFIVPGMRKDELFKTVIVDGVLPRKTFSMGEAHEKRFYVEARAIS